MLAQAAELLVALRWTDEAARHAAFLLCFLAQLARKRHGLGSGLVGANPTAAIRLMLHESARQIFTACYGQSSFVGATTSIVSSDGKRMIADVNISYKGVGKLRKDNLFSFRVTFQGVQAVEVALNADTGIVKPDAEELLECIYIINNTAAR